MPTLPDYPGVNWMQAESLTFPYESPNLRDKTNKSTLHTKIHFPDIFWQIFVNWGNILFGYLMNFWDLVCRSLLWTTFWASKKITLAISRILIFFFRSASLPVVSGSMGDNCLIVAWWAAFRFSYCHVTINQPIARFHMTSLKSTLQIYWFSRYFTFIMNKSSWKLVFIKNLWSLVLW